MLMKNPPNLVRIEEENRLFWIDEKPENFGQQKREKTRGKSILDSISDL